MPMRAAARVACVSHAFLRSWRCHPNLTFSSITLGMNKKAHGNDEIAVEFCSKVDHILRNCSGIGVKKLKIHMCKYYNAKGSCYLDSWLHIAVTPGIEELELTLPMETKYNFPCSGVGTQSGISTLLVAPCIPQLNLLGCFLCSSFALEQLEIWYCDEIVCLKIPCMLQRLRYLEVFGCDMLQVIDSKAPNISSFCYEGDHRVQLSLGETLKMKNIRLIFSGSVHYARVELPSSMPNLKIAAIRIRAGRSNTPMLHSKFLHLKKLNIGLTAATFSPSYDYFSLVSFLGAYPSLETLVLDVSIQLEMEHVSIFTDPSDLRKMQGQQHHKMKRVKILGFTSARSLIELTCHIVESTTSLGRLTLETHQSCSRCSVPAHKTSKCSALPVEVVMEARQAVLAIRTYVEPKD
ncbi:unnamed protein product [Urochloa decumbens]|uniref:At1g61320/AtMIF1 LRR domain-containing protein n=1 Tax=Urochloa decumbens TaxID=240449 RepID=A0ABC9GUD3_9POAL